MLWRDYIKSDSFTFHIKMFWEFVESLNEIYALHDISAYISLTSEIISDISHFHGNGQRYISDISGYHCNGICIPSSWQLTNYFNYALMLTSILSTLDSILDNLLDHILSTSYISLQKCIYNVTKLMYYRCNCGFQNFFAFVWVVMHLRGIY